MSETMWILTQAEADESAKKLTAKCEELERDLAAAREEIKELKTARTLATESTNLMTKAFLKQIEEAKEQERNRIHEIISEHLSAWACIETAEGVASFMALRALNNLIDITANIPTKEKS